MGQLKTLSEETIFSKCSLLPNWPQSKSNEIGNLMKAKDMTARGYFPVQLPPAFQTRGFASALVDIAQMWDVTVLAPGKSPVNTIPHRFSVARSSYNRRTTSLVNPIGFYALAKEIEIYWDKLEAHFEKSLLSRSRPFASTGLRSIELSKFSEIHDDRLLMSSGFRYVLITDISTYFPSIYTHTIPWALHGKSIAKKHKTKIPTYFGNILDHRSMCLQDGQTIGLPIGPDTSHIISEIIGTAIDIALCDDLGFTPSGFRYVDDYALFFDTREEAETALAAITKAVSSYELQINASKTRIIESRELVSDSWKYNLKHTKVAPSKREQRNDLHHFFETVFSLESRYKDEALVKYGLKQISSTIVKKSNWPTFESYLLKCGYGFPNTLQVIATILATYNFHGYPLSREAIARFCRTLLKSNVASRHHSEAAWLLWICKELQLSIQGSVVEDILKMGSDVCSLIALDLREQGLVNGDVDVNGLTALVSTEALLGSNWLLSYEGGRRGWIGNADTTFIEQSDVFSPLLHHDIHFYEASGTLSPIFDFKEDSFVGEFDFDSDEDIDDDFEFDEMDDEYFDSTDDDEDDEDEDQDEDQDEDLDDEFNERVRDEFGL
jgi:hypothetical protein